MSTTLKKVAEQVARAAAKVKGKDNVSNKDIAEAKPLVIQAINKVLAAIPQSGGEIPNSVIASYSSVSVTDASPEYYCTLPAHPIYLTHDRGVHSVRTTATADPFIPVPLSMYDVVKTMDEGVLEQMVGYYVEGDRIYFTGNPQTSDVLIKLYVADPATIGDDDVLPINADLEQDVIQAALMMMFPGQEDK